MKRTLISLAIASLILTGCATGSATRKAITGKQFDEPVVEQNTYLEQNENKLLPPAGGPMPVAVYAFQDKTGQRKSVPLIASLSSAVTQGGENYLIKALQDVGDQRWFIVLERVGLENLIKERQMIRQMREQYQGRDAKPLPPMMFAGIIMEGSIVGYDSNTLTGGSGVRLFGIGATTQYQSDTVTVTLRTVSVSTGEVLTSVTVTKTVLSYMDKFGALKFVENGEKAIEAEIGASINESINRATSLAIQAAVVGTIKEGARKGHWAFREERPSQVPPVFTLPLEQPKVEPKVIEAPRVEAKEEPKVEPKVEVKTEPKVEAKAEVVAPKAKTKQAKSKVNVREIPVAGAKIVAVISMNEVVEVLEEKDNSVLIKVANDKKGWVAKEFLK